MQNRALCRLREVATPPAASMIGLHAVRVEGACKTLNVINAAGARKTNEPPTHMMAAPRT